jgi:peptidoglycan hydrolase-like protein with peptidoglycan-binding domain
MLAGMLAGCELPSSLEELAKIFEGQTEETQDDRASAVGEQPQEDAEAEAAAALRDEAATPADPAEAADAAVPKPARETILTAQTLLAGLGYEPGPLDGLDGPKTRDAVRRYQADAGLPGDGRVTKALVENLSEADRANRGSDNTGPDNTGRAGGLDLASKKALPVYAPGDTFVYSDGRSETVTEIDGERVHWRSNDGTVLTAYRNFILPAIRRDTDLISEQTTVDVGPGALWPLKAGREVSFTANTEVTHKTRSSPRGGSAARWHCLVEAPRTVSVAAGTFEALRVVCRTSTPSAQGPTERVWYYAPRIRHYLRRQERFESPGSETPGSETDVELVAVRLEGKGWPPAARAGLGWALQEALETKADGQSIEWGSSGVDATVTIEPTAALRKSDSPYCRTFEQTVRSAAGERIYPGKACRSAAGQWLIPGLESLPQAAKSGS